MVNSIKELKETLGIKTITVNWNEQFPDYMLKSVYSESSIAEDINDFYDTISESGQRFFINRKSLYNLGLLAEMHNLILAYFVKSNVSIELFFYPKLATNEWLATFKEHLNRRQFFNNVKSYRTLKRYVSIFELSSYYQLISPERPITSSKVNVIKLNNDYILIQYLNDIYSPDYRVIKPGIKFKSFIPSIEYNPELFDCITLEVDNKKFIGDSLKHLWDMEEREKKLIEVEGNGIKYILNPESAEVTSPNGTVIIDKFKRDSYTKIIIDREYKGKRAIVLSNGFIWYPLEDKFVNMRSLEGFENLDVELLGMSSEQKGLILSLDENSIECVPTVEFEKILFKKQ